MPCRSDIHRDKHFAIYFVQVVTKQPLEGTTEDSAALLLQSQAFGNQWLYLRLNTQFALPQWIDQLCFCIIIFNLLSYTLPQIVSLTLLAGFTYSLPYLLAVLDLPTSYILTDCKLTRPTIPWPLRHSPPSPQKNPEPGYQGSISRTAPSLLRGRKYTESWSACWCLLSASSKDSTQWSSCKSSIGTVTPEPFRLQWTSSDHLVQHPAPARSAAATCPAHSQLKCETLPPLWITHTSMDHPHSKKRKSILFRWIFFF